MQCLDQHQPQWDVRSFHERIVAAPADRVFAAIQRLDLSASPVVRVLFRLRGLPSSALSLGGLERLRFVVLAEAPPHELALGVIGRFWSPSGSLRHFEPQQFRAFNEPGFAKAAWGFRTVPCAQGTLVQTETRISATDPISRRRFKRYWMIVGPFSGWIRREALRLIAADAEAAART